MLQPEKVECPEIPAADAAKSNIRSYPPSGVSPAYLTVLEGVNPLKLGNGNLDWETQ
jgi:hypothetical protein